MTNNNKKEQVETTSARKLEREEWIARAVAAAAMTPGRRKPPARPADKD